MNVLPPGARVVRADYISLDLIARRFGVDAGAIRAERARLLREMDVLRSGDWTGHGARQFYLEMDAFILPALQRLGDALESASRATQQIRTRILQAENNAAQVLGAEPVGEASAATPGAMSRITDLPTVPIGQALQNNLALATAIDQLMGASITDPMTLEIGWRTSMDPHFVEKSLRLMMVTPPDAQAAMINDFAGRNNLPLHAEATRRLSHFDLIPLLSRGDTAVIVTLTWNRDPEAEAVPAEVQEGVRTVAPIPQPKARALLLRAYDPNGGDPRWGFSTVTLDGTESITWLSDAAFNRAHAAYPFLSPEMADGTVIVTRTPASP